MLESASTKFAECSGWDATLVLECEHVDGRSRVTSRRHTGPLQIQRSFYPEGSECCHIYLLHPPGGIAGADRLTVNASVGSGAHLLLTTPAAAKLYRSERRLARQTQRFRLAPGSRLEWLPAEAIAFDGTWAELVTRVDLEDDARFIGWEMLCFGRPACAERFARGEVTQRFELYQNDRPLWLERGRYPGDARVLREAWGLGNHPVAALFVCTPSAPDAEFAVRAAFALHAGVTCSVTTLRSVLVGRVLGARIADVRGALESAWAAVRPSVLGRSACAPRIWKT